MKKLLEELLAIELLKLTPEKQFAAHVRAVLRQYGREVIPGEGACPMCGAKAGQS
jgi:hypothetical protein